MIYEQIFLSNQRRNKEPGPFSQTVKFYFCVSIVHSVLSPQWKPNHEKVKCSAFKDKAWSHKLSRFLDPAAAHHPRFFI